MPQTRIPPRYRVIEEVGQGGMAVVYRAHDESLKREVAVKVLHAHLSAEPESKARLQREAQAVAKLHHDNIVEIFDYSGIDSESSYIVTEFVDGQNLKQFMAARPLGWPDVAALMAAEVSGALAHAHSVGIIHRDVKPENVMIRKDGILKLMDFGIAQVVDLQRMTVTGQLLGSPAYMAPELIDGKPLDVRTDVFSVGIMLYQLATGELPFSGKNPGEVLRRIVEGKFVDPRVRQKRLSDDLRTIICRALARQPDDRYPDVSRLLDDLRGYLGGCGITDARVELRAFFAEPDLFEKSFPARAAAALADKGRTAMADGKTGVALKLWNRALLLDPQNAAVLAGLRRLEGRRRIRRVASIAVGLALGIGALIGVAKAFKPAVEVSQILEPPRPPPPKPMPPPAAVLEHVSPTPDEDDTDHTPVARPKRRLAAAKAATESVQTRIFNVGATPSNFTVFLDGREQFQYGPEHTSIAIPLDDRHTVEFRSPCCEPAKFVIDPDEPPKADLLLARLKGKTAELTIKTDPPLDGVRLRVSYKHGDGPHMNVLATPGQPVPIKFAAGEDFTKDVEITAFVGGETQTTKISIKAGQAHPFSLGLTIGMKTP